MNHRHAAVSLSTSAVVLALTLAACGGGAPPAPAPPKTPAEGAAEKKPAVDATPKEPQKTAADHHRDFMTGCAKKAVNSPDYCECAWGELRKVFTDDDLNDGNLSAEKLDKVKQQVAGACASKIPEEAVKAGYDQGCQNNRPEMKVYCDCTWTEFRKRFSAAELGDEATVQGDRFLAARTPVVKACSAKMPESIAKDAFMKGCAKDPKSNNFCGCAWKELRKQVSAAEIEAAAFDQEKVFAQVEKGCGKLRPPK